MPTRNYSNTAVETTLNGAITNVATSLTVNSDVGFPAVPFTIQCESEVILVTARTGTNFSTVTRGYDGTSAVAHNDAVTVKHVVVAKDFDDRPEANEILKSQVFNISGASVAQTYPQRWYPGRAITLVNVFVGCGTAPTGGTETYSIKISGTDAYPTSTNPAIAAAANADTALRAPDNTAVSASAYVQFVVETVGSTTPAEDVVAVVYYTVD